MSISAFTYANHSKTLSATTQVRQNSALFIAIAGCASITKKATPPKIALNCIPRSCDIVIGLRHVQPPLGTILVS